MSKAKRAAGKAGSCYKIVCSDGSIGYFREGESIDVVLSQNCVFPKRVEQLVAGEALHSKKFLTDLTEEDLEQRVLEGSERYRRAKNTFLRIFKGGKKTTALRCLILQAFSDKLNQAKLNAEGLDNMIIGELVTDEERLDIIKALYEKIKEHARLNKFEPINQSSLYNWLNGRVMMPREKRYLALLAGLNPEFKRFNAAFCDNADSTIRRDYMLLTGLQRTIKQFLPKYVGWVAGLRQSGKGLNEILSPVSKESAGECSAAAGMEAEPKKREEWYKQWLETTPELKLILKCFDGQELQYSMAYVKKVVPVSEETYNQEKARAGSKLSGVKGRICPSGDRPGMANAVSLKELIEVSSVFNAMLDEIFLRYMNAAIWGRQRYQGISAITTLCNLYFGVRNIKFDLFRELLAKEALPGGKKHIQDAEQLIEDIKKGKVDEFLKLENSTLLELIEKSVRVKNALPHFYWEFERLALIQLAIMGDLQAGEDRMCRLDYVRSFESKKGKREILSMLPDEMRNLLSMTPGNVQNRVKKDLVSDTRVRYISELASITQKMGQAYEQLKKTGYDDLKRRRLLSTYVFEGPHMLQKIGMAAKPSGSDFSDARMRTQLIAMGMMIGYGAGGMDPLRVLDEITIITGYRGELEGCDEFVMSWQEVKNMLVRYGIGDCIALLHPNNFIRQGYYLNSGLAPTRFSEEGETLELEDRVFLTTEQIMELYHIEEQELNQLLAGGIERVIFDSGFRYCFGSAMRENLEAGFARKREFVITQKEEKGISLRQVIAGFCIKHRRGDLCGVIGGLKASGFFAAEGIEDLKIPAYEVNSRRVELEDYLDHLVRGETIGARQEKHNLLRWYEMLALKHELNSLVIASVLDDNKLYLLFSETQDFKGSLMPIIAKYGHLPWRIEENPDCEKAEGMFGIANDRIRGYESLRLIVFGEGRAYGGGDTGSLKQLNAAVHGLENIIKTAGINASQSTGIIQSGIS